MWLQGILGEIGTGLILVFALLSFLIIAFNISFRWYKKKMKEAKEEETAEPITETEEEDDKVFAKKTINKNNTLKETDDDASDNEKKSTIELEVSKGERYKKNEIIEDIKLVGERKLPAKILMIFELTIEPKTEQSKPFVPKIEETEEKLAEKLVAELGPFDPKLELRDFKLPSVDLLDDYENTTVGVQKEELEANKNRIVETLNNYAIQIDKIKATIGPTVTLYEIVPAAGVRISRKRTLKMI